MFDLSALSAVHDLAGLLNEMRDMIPDYVPDRDEKLDKAADAIKTIIDHMDVQAGEERDDD